MPCNKGKVWSFRKLWLFNNSKRIELLSSATSACLNFTLPSWLEKPEHMDSYTTDPPQHSGCPDKAQETKLFPNSLHEPIHLPDKKNARPWVFGLATRNEDLTGDPEAAAAHQQLCSQRMCLWCHWWQCDPVWQMKPAMLPCHSAH